MSLENRILAIYWYNPQISEVIANIDSQSQLDKVIVCNNTQPSTYQEIPVWQLDVSSAYEERPVQTLLMCQRFLQHDYSHLLKIEYGIKWFDFQLLGKLLAFPPHYAGKFWRLKHQKFAKDKGIDLRRHYKFCGPQYQVKYTQHTPPISGFAFQYFYLISRKVAAAIVKQGIWYARSHIYEDMMVGCVAEKVGIRLVHMPVYSMKDKTINELDTNNGQPSEPTQT